MKYLQNGQKKQQISPIYFLKGDHKIDLDLTLEFKILLTMLGLKVSTGKV